MNILLKTAIDTTTTAVIIAPAVYQEPVKEAVIDMVNTGDLKAPIIALISSILIQLTLKLLSVISKKFFKTDLQNQ